jgi:peptidoglycan/LPS O-acetylase OafA/YrhL
MIPVVNGLRGLAILAVLFEHLTSGVRPAAGPFLPGTSISLSPVVWSGWTGVNLFFLLSGFVLFYPYANGRRTMASWGDARAFYRRRFLRLMPLYWLAIVVELAMDPKPPLDTALVVSGLFAASPTVHLWNWPLWSIGVEIYFSIMFPALILLWQRLGAWKLVAAVLLIALPVRAAGYLLSGSTTGADTVYFTNSPIGRLDEFVLGMLIAQLYVARRITVPAVFLIVPGVILILTAWLGYDLARQGFWAPVMDAPMNNVLDLGFALTFAGALAPAGYVSRLLSLRPLQVLGMMCYSIYIWHVPVQLVLFRPSRLNNIAYTAGSLFYLVLVLALAAISYRFVEFRDAREWRPLFLLPVKNAA